MTGDHETGGMTIGHATTAYTAYYDKLLAQTNSFTYFEQNQWKEHYDNNDHEGSYVDTADNFVDSDMDDLMLTVFGLEYASLNDYQKEKLV